MALLNKIILTVLLLLVMVSIGSSGTVTLYSTKDTYVDEANPFWLSGGAVSQLQVYNESMVSNDAYFYFSTMPIPSSVTITSATLYMYGQPMDVGGINVSVFALESLWNEYDTSWNTQPNSATVSLGSFNTAPSGYKSINITNKIQSYYNNSLYNYGLRVASLTNSSDWQYIYSREGGESYQPYIEVAYSTVSGSNISGTVHHVEDSVEVPISGASVQLWNNLSTIMYTALSSSDGSYSFTGLSNNQTYYLQAKKQDEYLDGIIDIITVGNNATYNRNLRLEPCSSSFNCFYNKGFVIYTLMNNTDPHLTNVQVSVYKGYDSTASDSSNTGDDGSVTFLLIKDQPYRLVFNNATQNISNVTWYGTPSLPSYIVYTTTLTGSPVGTQVPIQNLTNYTINYTSQDWSIQDVTGSFMSSSLGIGPMAQGILVGTLAWVLVGSTGVFGAVTGMFVIAFLGIITWTMALFIAMTAVSIFVLMGGLGQSW